MRVRVAAVLLGVLTGLTAAPPAVFAGPPTASSTKEQFAAAQKQFDEKDYAGALTAFRKLLAESSSPNARLYVARCLRELGNLVEAYDEMSATLKEATTRADSEPKYVPTRDAAAAELALIEPRVGKIVIALAQAPSDAEVALNGKPLAADRVGIPVPVEPGTIHVTAKASGGKASTRQDVVIKPGETKTVALTLSEDVSPEPTQAAPAPTSTQPDSTPRGGAVRTLGYVTAGVGVIGLGVFAFAALSADSKFDTVKSECGNVRCTDKKYESTIDSGKTLDMVANIGLVGGIVGLTAGTTMIIFGGPRESHAKAGLKHKVAPATASIRVSPTSGTILVRGQF